MFRAHHLAGAMLIAARTPVFVAAKSRRTIEQFLSPASPLELQAAKRADRIAWTTDERGMRNVYSAAPPEFKPVRLTRFLQRASWAVRRTHMGVFLNRFVRQGEAPPSPAGVKP